MPPVGQRSGHLEAQTAVVGLEDLQILFCCGLGDGCAISLEERDDPGDMVIELNGSNVEQGLARLLRARNLLAGSHLDPAPHPSANDGARRHCGSGLESMECRCRNSDDSVGDTNCSQIPASNHSVDRVMADIEPIRDLFDGIPSLLGHLRHLRSCAWSRTITHRTPWSSLPGAPPLQLQRHWRAVASNNMTPHACRTRVCR